MYKVFLVEDDPGIASCLSEQLSSWGMQVASARDFRDILPQFAEFSPHIVLMDIVLPFYNGYHWCEQIRKISSVPILFLSSAGDDMNQVMAMNLGADGFIAKPFSADVVLAKVQALLRRSYIFAGETPMLQYRGAFFNPADSTLTYQGQTLELTKNEHRILLLLLQNKGKIVSREKLMESLWQSDDFVDENTLSVNVNRLRKKLAAVGLSSMIEARFKVGYLIPKEEAR